jgi:hypothetical protein
MIHNPLYSPELAKRRVEEEAKAQLAWLHARPRPSRNTLNNKPVKANAETKAFISYLKRTPSIKAILADTCTSTATTASFCGRRAAIRRRGGYYGCGEVFEFS